MPDGSSRSQSALLTYQRQQFISHIGFAILIDTIVVYLILHEESEIGLLVFWRNKHRAFQHLIVELVAHHIHDHRQVVRG